MRFCRETPNNACWLSVGITINKLSIFPNFIRTEFAHTLLFQPICWLPGPRWRTKTEPGRIRTDQMAELRV
jgi:hypothetical protein